MDCLHFQMMQRIQTETCEVSYQPETVTPLLHFFSQFSKAVVMVLYFFLLMSVIVWAPARFANESTTG